MPFGYTIASFFLQCIMEPTTNEFLTAEGQEKFRKTYYTRGGEPFLREMHEQIMEMNRMYTKFNMKLNQM